MHLQIKLNIAQATCAPLLAATTQALFGRGKLQERAQRKQQKQTRKQQQQEVAYGRDWYTATREVAQPKRSVRQELEYRRQANLEANNGRERKDLYTENWDGAEYKGSPWNILNVLLLLSILAPIAGLIFAFQTYGILWG